MGKVNCLICKNELKKYNKKMAQAHKECLDILMHPPFEIQALNAEPSGPFGNPIMAYDWELMVGNQLIRRIIDFKLIMDNTGDPVKAQFTIHFPSIQLVFQEDKYRLILGAD